MLKAFFRAYGPLAAFWCGLEIVALMVLQHFYHDTSEEFWFKPNFFLIVASFAALSVWQALALGWIFNPCRRGSWVRLLPVSAKALFVLPAALILGRGIYLSVLLRDLLWVDAPLYAQAPGVFLFVLPLTVFVMMRRARLFLPGAFATAGVCVAALLVYAFGFYQWQVFHALFITEVAFAVVFGLLAVSLETEARGLAFGLTTLVLALPLAFRGLVAADAALPEVTAAAAYLPRAAVVERLRAFAQDPAPWTARDTGGRILAPSMAYALPRVAALTLDDAGRLALTKKILANASAFRFPGEFGKETAFYPIGTGLVTPATGQWLAESWEDTDPHCKLAIAVFDTGGTVPLEKFLGSSCRSGADMWGFWRQYRPWRASDSDRQFEAALLRTQAAAPIGARFAIFESMIRTGGASREKKGERDELLGRFAKEGVDAASLATWRTLYRQDARAILRKKLQSPESFESWLSGLSRRDLMNQPGVYTALHLLCDELAPDCVDHLSVFRAHGPLAIMAIRLWAAMQGEDIFIWEFKRKIRESPAIGTLPNLAARL